MKKLLSFIITLAVAFTFSAPALASDNPFTDIKETDWFYEAVMKANELGLLKGTGNNQYSPEGELTCSQFITIAVRAIGKEAEAQGYSGAGDHWSYGYYRVAQKYGLIKSGEFGDANRDRAMTREEMAYISMNVLKHNNEYPEKTMPLNNIPDIAKVKDDYNIGAVQFCYSMGVLVGVDTQGNYNPQGVLKRNAGATVAVRLVDASARKTPNFDAKPQQQQQQTPQGQQTSQGQQTWKEGETHQPAKAGDVVIKADGTKVVLEEKWGVLGAGQGVDYVTGTNYNGYNLSNPERYTAWYDGDHTNFIKCAATGEVFTRQQWQSLKKPTWPGRDGTSDGEIVNCYWKWNSAANEWRWIGGSSNG